MALPFIGASYENADPTTFRVAVIGINAYVSDGDWPKDRDKMRGWYPGWWRAAGHGKSQRFFNVAHREANVLAQQLAEHSDLFPGLMHDADPKTKSGFYCTNAVKVLLGEGHKKAQGITPDFLALHIPTWHQELKTMAKHRVMPHLIVVLGNQVWDVIWRSLHPDTGFAPEHFTVDANQSCGDPCFHHANLITVNVGGRKHPAGAGDAPRCPRQPASGVALEAGGAQGAGAVGVVIGGVHPRQPR